MRVYLLNSVLLSALVCGVVQGLQCDGTVYLDGDSGTISNTVEGPFGEPYNSDADCTWEIYNDDADAISISFEIVKLEPK